MKKIIIALDGHSACGKSTLAKLMAKELGYIYVDSGAMYRAVTYYLLENNIIKTNKTFNQQNVIEALDDINISFNYNRVTGQSETYLNGICVEDEIRTLDVSKNVSKISTIPEVRAKLVELQQRIGKNKGIVMDGRDIGTVVFPNADLKLWITASNEVRAARRYKEMLERGHNVSLDEVVKNVLERDRIDSTREVSPLIKAEDAIEIDNSTLSKEETLQVAMRLVNQTLLME